MGSGPFWVDSLVVNCFSVDSEVDSVCPIFLIVELLKSTHAYGLSTYAVLEPGEKLDKVDDKKEKLVPHTACLERRIQVCNFTFHENKSIREYLFNLPMTIDPTTATNQSLVG